MITIDSLRNAYVRSFQTGGSARKAHRAGVNWEKATGNTSTSSFEDFLDFIGNQRLLNNYGKQTGSNIVSMYENFLRSRGELGDNQHYNMEGNPHFAKDLTDVFRKVSKNANGDLQKWWDDNRKAWYEYNRTHSVSGGAAASKKRVTPPNAEERDIPDVEPGNGADEVPTTQNPNPGAGNTPNPGVGGGATPEQRDKINSDYNSYIANKIKEDALAAPIESEPDTFDYDSLYNEINPEVELDESEYAVSPEDLDYNNLYHNTSRKGLRQFARGKDNSYLGTTLSGSQRRQTARGIRQGRREDARNYLDTGEYNYEYKTMPEYQRAGWENRSAERSAERDKWNNARGIMNGQYPSQRNGGAMMRTFIGAMRRGGRL